jgi:hypothetical protein
MDFTGLSVLALYGLVVELRDSSNLVVGGCFSGDSDEMVMLISAARRVQVSRGVASAYEFLLRSIVSAEGLPGWILGLSKLFRYGDFLILA